MIELQLLAALDAVDRAGERMWDRRPRALGSLHALAAAGGLVTGWLARALIQGNER